MRDVEDWKAAGHFRNYSHRMTSLLGCPSYVLGFLMAFPLSLASLPLSLRVLFSVPPCLSLCQWRGR